MDNKPLEIEKEWGEEKAHRQATAVVHDAAPKRSNTWIWVLIGVVVAGVVAAGVVVQMKAKPAHTSAAQPATEGKVRFEIRANPPAMITIDGKRAGKTPLSLYVSKGTAPIGISNGRQTKAVIPDQDQLIDFTIR
jgi:hypothetical protein